MAIARRPPIVSLRWGDVGTESRVVCLADMWSGGRGWGGGGGVRALSQCWFMNEALRICYCFKETKTSQSKSVL